MVKIEIKRIPLKYFYYYQWLVLGLYQLSIKNEIKLVIKPEKLADKIFTRFYFLYLGLRKYNKWFRNIEKDNYCLEAEITFGKHKLTFCYDIADCPYFYDLDNLKKADLYFKAQCPIEIENEGFPLTPNIRIPYSEIVLSNKEKIKPSMLGPSCKSTSLLSFKKLSKGLDDIMYKGGKKEGILMCYFGNSKGPKPTCSQAPDLYNKESDILGYFGERISHPNEKRAVVAKIINKLGKRYDGRIINDGNFGIGGKPTNAHLYIPLTEYASHISKFKYNFNVSGNRLSIPNRFIYSFAVGTAIITDRLHVKWYKPFVKEVIETTEMGYLKKEEVDWESFCESIKNLPDVDPDEVLFEFKNKWAPEPFARYIVNTCLDKIKLPDIAL